MTSARARAHEIIPNLPGIPGDDITGESYRGTLPAVIVVVPSFVSPLSSRRAPANSGQERSRRLCADDRAFAKREIGNLIGLPWRFAWPR